MSIWFLAIALGAAHPGECVACGPLQAPAGRAVSADAAELHARARAAVDEVLATREFRRGHGSSIWQRLMRWVRQALAWLGRRIDGLPGWLAWLVVIWLVLTLVAILAHMVYVIAGLFGARSARSQTARAAAFGRGELHGIRDLDFDSVFAQAGRLLAGGDWPGATRYLYVAAILWLDRHNLISFQPAKTNHDYVAELAGRPERTAFRELTGRFESTVHGGRAADAHTCREMSDLVESLRRDPAHR